jgi:hypothetical protein
MGNQTWKFLITAGLLVELAIAMNLDSWQVYRVEAQKAEQAQRQLREAQQARLRILEQSARLESPGGMEEMARSMGFRKEGEIPLSETPEKPQPTP